MSANFLLVFCAQSVFLQFVQGQCTPSATIAASPRTYVSTIVSPSSASSYPSHGCPEIIAPAIEVTPTTGGALPVTCLSAFPEEPLTVASDNAYEGTLSVNGELPFVGTVSVSGELPTAGSGAVNHACGSNVRITKEFSRPVMGNSIASANEFVASASAAASNSDFKRGFGPRPSNLGYADSAVAGLGLVNNVGAAVGLGNGRYRSTGAGKTAFSVAGVGNVAYSANALSNVGFRGAPAGNIGYGVNGITNTGYGGVCLTNAGYGGTGEGTMAVVGELPVAGTTAVVGQLPIVGAVYYNGNVPAFGTVTVSGSCSCGCDRYLY